MAKRYSPDEPINMGRFLVDHGAKPRKSKSPFIVRDYYNGPLAYESPLSGKTIDSRIERQKEMKEFNVREVDPSERAFHREDDRHIDHTYAAKRGIDASKYDAKRPEKKTRSSG